MTKLNNRHILRLNKINKSCISPLIPVNLLVIDFSILAVSTFFCHSNILLQEENYFLASASTVQINE